MTEPNENGVYEPEITRELARYKRSYVALRIAQCRDGLFRSALDYFCSTFGGASPITDCTTGYVTAELAESESLPLILKRFPKPAATDAQSVRDEVNALRSQLEARFREPTLF